MDLAPTHTDSVRVADHTSSSHIVQFTSVLSVVSRDSGYLIISQNGGGRSGRCWSRYVKQPGSSFVCRWSRLVVFPQKILVED